MSNNRAQAPQSWVRQSRGPPTGRSEPEISVYSSKRRSQAARIRPRPSCWLKTSISGLFGEYDAQLRHHSQCVDVTPVLHSLSVGYAVARRPDPRVQRLILDALGDGASVVNVGAGAGNYEPTDRLVVAVEPSLTMIAQRGAGTGPVARAVAEALPFKNRTFDAALATVTLHHWADWPTGLSEMRRVARRQVILLFEPSE